LKDFQICEVLFTHSNSNMNLNREKSYCCSYQKYGLYTYFFDKNWMLLFYHTAPDSTSLESNPLHTASPKTEHSCRRGTVTLGPRKGGKINCSYCNNKALNQVWQLITITLQIFCLTGSYCILMRKNLLKLDAIAHWSKLILSYI